MPRVGQPRRPRPPPRSRHARGHSLHPRREDRAAGPRSPAPGREPDPGPAAPPRPSAGPQEPEAPRSRGKAQCSPHPPLPQAPAEGGESGGRSGIREAGREPQDPESGAVRKLPKPASFPPLGGTVPPQLPARDQLPRCSPRRSPTPPCSSAGTGLPRALACRSPARLLTDKPHRTGRPAPPPASLR